MTQQAHLFEISMRFELLDALIAGIDDIEETAAVDGHGDRDGARLCTWAAMPERTCSRVGDCLHADTADRIA